MMPTDARAAHPISLATGWLALALAVAFAVCPAVDAPVCLWTKPDIFPLRGKCSATALSSFRI